MVSIIKAKRSAIGSFNGMYKDIDIVDMGADLLKNISVGLDIDELILGNVLFKDGQNLARQISIKSGLSENIPSFVVNQVCGSGMRAIWIAYQSILNKDNSVVVAGGIEKMSNVEEVAKKALTDDFYNIHMGLTAENIVDKYGFSREELDDFSYSSQMKVKEALDSDKFKDEIYNDEKDEYPRINLERSKLSTLRTVFKENGKVTAGNSSGINDGVAMLVLMDKEKAEKENFEILANIIGFSSYANDPRYMGLAPIESTKKLLNKYNLTVEDVDIFEINEAFASVVLAYQKELNISNNKINVNGGAISLGHPIGASGARIIVTMINEMKRSNLKRGIASICIGGGQAISVLIER